MARRERERYSERARPHRAAGSGEGGGPTESGLRNPAVIVALLGLATAGVMAIGFMFGRGTQTPDSAAGTTPTVAADAATTPSAPTPDAAAATPVAGDAPQPAADAASRADMYKAPEDQALDAAGTAYFATIETNRGPITLELWPDAAPEHVNAFIFLARKGFYDGLTFHRVEPGFVIQGGDPTGTGGGGPGYTLPGEFNADNPIPHRAGTLAMARTSDPNSAGSQFYVVLADSPNASSLDGQYTNFGHVISGMDTLAKIQKGDVMTKVTIEEKPKSDSVVSPDDIRAGKVPGSEE